MSTSTSSSKDQQRPALSEIFRRAGKRAIGGGVPGAVAMGAQVLTLMPLRSTMNYQYRYGNSTTVTAIRTLYADGGIRRFYRGIGPALFQGPLSRFGDTAANSGVLSLLDSFDSTKNWPVGVKTAAASGAAASWRIFLMREFSVTISVPTLPRIESSVCHPLTPPIFFFHFGNVSFHPRVAIDAMKTTLQVEGAKGLTVLRGRITQGGPFVLYHGAIATYSATWVGQYVILPRNDLCFGNCCRAHFHQHLTRLSHFTQ